MPGENVRIALAQLDALSKRDVDTALVPYAAEFSLNDHAQGRTVRDRAELRTWLEQWLVAMSNGSINVCEVVGAGDVVVVQFVFEGTQDGPLERHAPTSRYASIEVCKIWRFNTAGRIVRDDSYYDRLGLLVQLGLAEEPV